MGINYDAIDTIMLQRAPALGQVSSSERLAMIESVCTFQLDADAFGASFQLAAALLSAHFLTLNQMAGNNPGGGGNVGGPVTRLKEGALEKEFASPIATKYLRPSDAALMSTTYGLQYIMVRNSSIMAVDIRRGLV